MTDYLSTLKPSGGDYTDVSSFEADLPANIGSGDRYLLACDSWQGESGGALDDPTDFIGTTCADDTARVIIYGTDGSGKHDGTLDSGFTWTGGAGNVIDIGTATFNLTLEDIQLGISGSVRCVDASVACDVITNRCLFDLGTGSGLSSWFSSASSIITYNSCVIAYGSSIMVRATSANTTLNFVTVYGTGSNKIAFCVCTGVIGMGAGSDFIASDASSNYNISADTSAPGANTLKSKTSYASYFEDHLNGNFLLLDTTGDGGVFGATGLVGVAGPSFGVRGNARSVYDIGADEFGGAAAAIIPQIMHHRQQQRST